MNDIIRALKTIIDREGLNYLDMNAYIPNF